MLLDPRVVYIAASINLIGIGGYAWDTLKGKTKPNRITWLLWTIAPLIAFFAQISEGAGLAAVLTLAIGLGPLLVLIASAVNTNAYWRVTSFDMICATVSLLALVLWAITDKGTVAIVLSIIADFMAAIPTIRKAYAHPETESSNAFLAGVIAAVLTILSVETFNFVSVAFPLYLLLNGLLLYVLIQFPKLRPQKALA